MSGSKCWAVLAAAAVWAISSGMAAFAAPSILPPITTSDMTVDGRTYSVFVMKPPTPPSAEGYPVLVVLDGNADFATAAASAYARAVFADMAPIVVVGIGYPGGELQEFLSRRAFDFTSATANETSPDLTGLKLGGAESFRHGVVAKVLANLEQNEHVNGRCRVLFGHSLGGLFVVDTMFRQPDLFEGYFAASPALHANDFEIFSRVPSKERLSTMLRAPVRLRLEVGELEAKISERQLRAFPAFRTAPDAKMVASVERLSELLSHAGSTNLHLTTTILKNESHMSEVPRVLSEAVSFTSECNSAEAQPLSEAAFRSHVATLASDAFEGRGPGTSGEEKTIEYISRTFAQAGLQPGGDQSANGQRSWTQSVPLRRSSIVGSSDVKITTPSGLVSWKQGDEIAIRGSLTGKSRVKVERAPVVFAGYGVTAPERNWDDYKKMDVRGKVLVMLMNDPDFETGSGAFGGKTMTWYGRSIYKFEEAAHRGALGVLLIHEDAAVGGYGWATTRNSNLAEVFDIDETHPEKEHALLEAWIQVGAAQDLFQRAGLDFAALKVAARNSSFRPVTLKGITLSTDHQVKTSVVMSHNVVAYLPGASRPDEYVAYTAHWDAHGVREVADANGDRIYHGAQDNASGTSMLLELGRYFATQPRPARSLIFIAVTAEEKGMLGSKYYSIAPEFPLERTAAVINMDGVLGAGGARSISILGDSQNTVQDKLKDLVTQSGRYLEPDPAPEAGYFTRSDQFYFAKQGVPALGFAPGSDLLSGGLTAGLAAKRDFLTKRYHQPADKYDPSMDFSNMPEDGLLLAKLGTTLAEAQEWPVWMPTSEYKPIRDRSRQSR